VPQVIVYTTAICPYCIRAKELLKRKRVEFEEVRIDLDQKRMREMLDRTKRRTVPQIYIGDHHVGGYDDLAELDAFGELDELLGR
jgi:glutaredoxin 3